MEKRIGVIAILLTGKKNVPIINAILTTHSEIILARQGLPLRDKGIHIISLVVEGTTDQIGALSGKIGKLEGVQVKSLLTKYKENEDESSDNGSGESIH